MAPLFNPQVLSTFISIMITSRKQILIVATHELATTLEQNRYNNTPFNLLNVGCYMIFHSLHHVAEQDNDLVFP